MSYPPVKRVEIVEDGFSSPYTVGPFCCNEYRAIAGTIKSDAVVDVEIYQGPDGIDFPIVSSFSTGSDPSDGAGDSFDVKVLDQYAKVVLTGSPTVFKASINMSRNEG